MKSEGILVRWNKAKCFGFIKSKAVNGDIFIHISELKHMSREPKIGDVIYFEIINEKNGKTKATNARIKGVSSKNRNSNIIFILLMLSIIIFSSLRIYHSAFNNQPLIPAGIKNIFIEDFAGYSCQGKTYCSQMRSCKEARFYLKNCPNVKIDGNNDGEPCEMQLCN